MTVTHSRTGYRETLEHLLAAITRRGLTVFARVDHAAGAREVGLELPPEEVVLFGNPRAGTPLMQADPRSGLDLPLRVLVWEESGAAHVGYEDPRALAERYDVESQRAALDAMADLLAGLAGDATKA
jgi:uncharacterized protein (DUF302 family)